MLDVRRLRSLGAAQCDVFVLGGGITGLSTAIVLQSLGWHVAILTQETPRQARAEKPNPLVPTGYAMASAYPHNLRLENLDGISAASQAVLAVFNADGKSGVHIYRMFEVFEHEPPEPPLAKARMNFRYFAGPTQRLKETLDPPARPGAQNLWGWCFDTYFADMPIYMAFLWALFETRGGLLVSSEKKLHLNAVLDVTAQTGAQPLVNCLGWGAKDFMSDRAPAVVMRGQQVLVPGAPMLRASDKVPLCFNYTPTPEVFPRADGTAEYVHFFPRADGWLLGQTREPGQLDSNDNWSGESVIAPQIAIGDLKIAAPIVSLNETLLQTWKQLPLHRNKLEARCGYRYYRDPDQAGVRLEAQSIKTPTDSTRLIVHNYGHGGSGITMGWGCALQAAKLLLDSGAGLGTRRGDKSSMSTLDQMLARQISYLQ